MRRVFAEHPQVVPVRCESLTWVFSACSVGVVDKSSCDLVLLQGIGDTCHTWFSCRWVSILISDLLVDCSSGMWLKLFSWRSGAVSTLKNKRIISEGPIATLFRCLRSVWLEMQWQYHRRKYTIWTGLSGCRLCTSSIELPIALILVVIRHLGFGCGFSSRWFPLTDICRLACSKSRSMFSYIWWFHSISSAIPFSIPCRTLLISLGTQRQFWGLFRNRVQWSLWDWALDHSSFDFSGSLLDLSGWRCRWCLQISPKLFFRTA